MRRAAEPDEDPRQWADPSEVTKVFVYLASDESIQELGIDYWQYIVNGDSNYIYDQFLPEIKAQYSKEQFFDSFSDISTYAQNLHLLYFSHSIFLGNRSGGRLFNYMYWVKNDDAKGFLTLTILDKNNKISVLGLNINANSFFKE